MSTHAQPMTKDQKAMLDLMVKRVTFLPGSWDKSFVYNVHNQDRLTEKQADWVKRLFHKYRRQIPNHERYCEECKKQWIPGLLESLE